ncbi:MAG: sulfatase-like hydrolase/transferase [Lachnospiraceae bacterium]|nr:sulfatase-like hydrolase/transferase [Lachnospiraceae bacterium]
MKNLLDKFKNIFIAMRKRLEPVGRVIKIPFVGYLLLACILNLTLETLSRHSLIKAIIFVGKSPVVFLYNAFIIFVTLSLVLFAKRRVFATVFVCAIWIISAFANFIVLCFRTTPFSAIDVLMIRNIMTMLDKYLTKWQMVLSAVGIVFVIGLLIYLYIRLPKLESKRHPLRASAYVCMCLILIVTLTKVAVETQTVSDNFGNLAYAYNDYGFAYCFSNSIIDVGIAKPSDYSEAAIESIVEDLEYDKGIISDVPQSGMDETDAIEIPEQDIKATSEYPNIIIIQLESIFDVKYMKDFYVSEDPMPMLTKLKENYSSGLFTVPAVGAGTANTEFEVQTGMSTKYFGAGEYPFKTIMTEKSCDSMAYDLKRLGYATAGFHNNDATFYERYIDYSNLGFDVFAGMEHMYMLNYTPRGWAKDDVLDDIMLERMEQTEGRDYITTISVQAHGRYPKKYTHTLTDITSHFEGRHAGDEEKRAAWTYYINMCRETDNMVASLLYKLEKLGEPTVVFMYGDHLPSLSLEQEDLEQISLYQTEWVMWDNIGLESEHKDMMAYQASTYIFNHLGIEGGLMQHFHSKYMQSANQEDYLHKLELLEYDTLYGENYAFDQSNPFLQTDMRLGLRDIYVSDYEVLEDQVLIYGSGFNEFSEVCIDDKSIETTYVNYQTLSVPLREIENGTMLCVAQTGDDHIVLSRTEAIPVTITGLEMLE